MRFLAFLLFLGCGAYVFAQPSTSVDPNVTLQLSIAGGNREFHVGETIPLHLAYSSALKDRYQVNRAEYDRSGRMEYEHFNLSPAEGVVDPLKDRLGGSTGGLTSFSFLAPQPWTIDLNLNEWVRFLRAGEYRLVVTSDRVSIKDASSPLGAVLITVESNEVTLRIIPVTKAWREETFRSAVAILDGPTPTKPEDREAHVKARHGALETLRFLGTADAAKELAKRLRGEDSGGLDYICMLGLISSPEQNVVRKALEKEMTDPDHPISEPFMWAVRRANTAASDENWQEAQKNVVEELIAALPAKRGKAFTVSLSTAVNEALNNGDIPRSTTDRLLAQMISMFDQLPVDAQHLLLTYYWDKISGPQMIPILRRTAEAYRDYPQMRDANAQEAIQLSASALRRWYELDPAGARPAIIREIKRPRPRFDAGVLGILPDKTLPEVDFTLAENLTASTDADGLVNISSLIARYASDAILPQVTAKLDPLIGKWGCPIQDPLLAYVLRVNPEGARGRIEAAIAARGEDYTACNRWSLQGISEIYYHPVLEEIGIHSLDDPDPQVAETAAAMLGRHGSPAAEPALFQRFKEWSATWAGRESELNPTFSEHGDPFDELGLGQNLAQALATGKSWLSDENTLQELSQLTKVKRVQDQLAEYSKIWQKQPLVISLSNNPPSDLDLRVAQYEFDSLDGIEEKLKQFPQGTRFILAATPGAPAKTKLGELRRFLSTHGLVVAGEKTAE